MGPLIEGEHMKCYIAALACAACLLAQRSLAQTQSRDALAEELLVVMQVKESIEQSIAAARAMLPAQMEELRAATGQPPSAPASTNDVNKLFDLIAKELSWENMEKDYVALYADMFSEEELRGMIAFFESPVGRTWLAKQPEIARRSLQFSQNLMMRLLPAMQSRHDATPAVPAVPAAERPPGSNSTPAMPTERSRP
jgi:hypothetical protein